MLELKLFALLLGAGFFTSTAIVVIYDICMAARLRSLLQQGATHTRLGRRRKPPVQNRRPTPLWVARNASLERHT